MDANEMDRDGSDGRSIELPEGNSECGKSRKTTGAAETGQPYSDQVPPHHAKEEYHISQPLVEYVGEFEIVDDHRGKKIVLDLLGRLNKCGVYSPRFDIKVKVMRLLDGVGDGQNDVLCAPLEANRLPRADNDLRNSGP